ncbi:hypothetical protein [Rodentibacter pneumotropicus]|uniref:hypothetical protein n=1 Tax=Rodentibacter pneumotropicus TaxID=758 RepID=UPI00109D4538|nr:hypothetical protein [Rodentibacter pneumotropicus]THA14540.1 hypothetical protein D3M82_07395 [Rodentibacter pneumotropicus]
MFGGVMGFKPLITGAIIIMFVGCIGSALHYKKQAETTALLLQKSEQTLKQNVAMLQRYESQNAELTDQLNRVNKQAELRRQQLKDVLNNEENKIWRDEPVPADVAGVFNNRAKTK